MNLDNLFEDFVNYECMWARLKETYAKPTKMIDLVLGDIKATKQGAEGDNNYDQYSGEGVVRH